MTASDPLDATADAAGEARRDLERAVSASEGLWSDGARRDFDAAYLTTVTAHAGRLEQDLRDLAKSARDALAALGPDD